MVGRPVTVTLLVMHLGMLFLIQPICALCMAIFIVEIMIKSDHETPPSAE